LFRQQSKLEGHLQLDDEDGKEQQKIEMLTRED
jgi:hypothetical protein